MSNLDRLYQALPGFVRSRLPVSVLSRAPKPEEKTSPPVQMPDPVEAMAVLLRGVALGKVQGTALAHASSNVLAKLGLQEGPALIRTPDGSWTTADTSSLTPSKVAHVDPASLPTERLRIEWIHGEEAHKAVYDPREEMLRYYRGATGRPALVLPHARMSEAQFIAFVDLLKSIA